MELNQITSYLDSLREKISHTLEESTYEEKFIIASNVLTEINHHIPRLSLTPKYSKLLENILRLLVISVENKENLYEKIELCLNVLTNLFTKSDFLKLSKDTFGSHVLQTSLNCLTVFNEYDSKFDSLLLYITNKIEEECLFELVYHSSGSHFLRTILMCLVNEVDKNEYSSKKTEFENLQINKEKVFEWRKKRLLNWTNLFLKDLDKLLKNTQSSVTYSLLISLLKQIEQLNKKNRKLKLILTLDENDLLLSIIKECIPKVTEYKNTSYVLETCLKCSNNYEYTYIYNNLITKNLQKLCEDQFGNYVIQSFIENQHFQASHLQYMIENINMGSLLKQRSSSIVWKLCKSCIYLYTCQELFYKKLINDFNINDLNTFWFVVGSSGNNYNEIFLKPSGSSVLEYLVKFQKSVIGDVIVSFKNFINIAIKNNKFLYLCCDVYFSRVLQNIFDIRLNLLSEKFIKKLIPIFEKHLVDLAIDFNGCYVLNSFFTLLKVENKVKFLTILVDDYDKIKLHNNKFVKMINLTQFKNNKKLFKKKLEKSETVRELFKDIVKK